MGEPIWKRLTNRFCLWLEGYLTSVIASFVAAFCAYTFAFTNKLMCADEVENLFAKGATISSGRWGLEITRLIFPDVSMPWIYGIITICLLCISCCLIIDIFSITNRALRVLLPVAIITFPSLIGTFAYMFTSASYGLAFLAAVLSVYCLKNGRNIAAFLMLVFSLGIYQAYIAIAASLLLLIIIQQLILARQELKIIIRIGAGYVLFLALALGVYYLISTVIVLFGEGGFNQYASVTLDPARGVLILRPVKAYFFYVAAILKGSFGLVQGKVSTIMHLMLIGVTALCILVLMLDKARQLDNKLWLLLSLALIPLAVNCMFLFVNEHAIHTLVLYGFAMNYVVVAVIWEAATQTPGYSSRMKLLQEDASVLALTVIIITNIFVANKAYLKLHLDYENTYSFFTSLIGDIKTTEGFDEESKIAIIGKTDNMTSHFEELENLGIVGITVFDLDKNNTGREKFIQRYCGFDAPFATEDEKEWIRSQKEFLHMNEYPYYGSIAEIDDFIVVKLSD